MKRKSNQYYIRKSHRYLGLLLGVQFFLWTLGGLYFSWNDLDRVHGDHLRAERGHFPASINLVSPQVVLDKLKASGSLDSVQSVQLVEIAGEPVYQVRYFSGEMEHAGHEASGHGSSPTSSNLKVQLANAESGEFLQPLTKEEAIRVAKGYVTTPQKVEGVEYLTEAGSHHEYREKPLPARRAVKF